MKTISKIFFIFVLFLTILLLLASLFLVARSVYYKYRYPLKYKDSITACVDDFGLSASLVSAVIYEESRFRPEAISPKGALGLMQILPDTASYISKKLGEVELDAESIIKPEVNIRYGCYYLDYLMKRYDNVEKALAAYNAGEGNVDKWLEKDDYEVKFLETSNFVERVIDSQKMYQKIYFENNK